MTYLTYLLTYKHELMKDSKGLHDVMKYHFKFAAYVGLL